MNEVVRIEAQSLPALVKRAAQALAQATNAAEVLEARQMADVQYDVAKRVARMAQAEAAHDEVVAAAHRAQGDALEIKAQASRRYFEETQAAIQRGELPGRGGDRGNQHTGGKVENTHFANPSRHKEIVREGGQVHRAEATSPGIIRRALDGLIARGEEPSKAAMREEVFAKRQSVVEAAERGLRPERRPAPRANPHYEPSPAFDATAAVAGSCRRILEHVEQHGSDRILDGCVDEAMRGRTLATLTACRDALTAILEHADA